MERVGPDVREKGRDHLIPTSQKGDLIFLSGFKALEFLIFGLRVRREEGNAGKITGRKNVETLRMESKGKVVEARESGVAANSS